MNDLTGRHQGFSFKFWATPAICSPPVGFSTLSSLQKCLKGMLKCSLAISLPCSRVKTTLYPCILTTLLKAVKARAWYLNLQKAKGEVSISEGFFPQEVQAKMRSRKVSY